MLLNAFHQGMASRRSVGDRTADRFQEETPVGLDQLLMIRLAQKLGAAPEKLRGSDGERISNQRPVAEEAANSSPKTFVVSFANMRASCRATLLWSFWNPAWRSD